MAEPPRAPEEGAGPEEEGPLTSRALAAAALLAAAGVAAAALLRRDEGPPLTGPFPADAEALGRIEALRGPAAAVRADGDPSDWAALPALTDPAGDAGGDPSLDLVAVAVAPTDEGLHVLLRTAGPPRADGGVYWLDVDAAGEARPEFQVGLSADGEHRVRVFDPAAETPTFRAPFPASVGAAAVEATLPWEALEAWSPRTGPTRGEGARGWVRVTATTWEPGADAVADAASAASWWLGGRPPRLDPRPEETPAAAVLLPVEGTWLVSQDAGGSLTHGGAHAYDLTRTDEGLRPAPPVDRCRLGAYRAWESPVRAPASGRVRRVRDGASDRPPCRAGASNEANEVLLDLGGGLALRFLHLRRGSAAVAPGARVAAGDLLARVGSSGASSAPHLHLELLGRRGGGTRPLAFRDVRVGLNPGPDDPWARTLPVWAPRAGFFVAPAAPARP